MIINQDGFVIPDVYAEGMGAFKPFKSVSRGLKKTVKTIGKAPSYASSAAKFGVKAATLPHRTAFGFTKGVLTETGRQAGKLGGSVIKLPFDVAKSTLKGGARALRGHSNPQLVKEAAERARIIAERARIKKPQGQPQGDFEPPGSSGGGGGGGSYSGAGGGGSDGGEPELQTKGLMTMPAAVSGMSTPVKVCIGLGVAGAVYYAWKKLGKGGRGAGNRKSF